MSWKDNCLHGRAWPFWLRPSAAIIALPFRNSHGPASSSYRHADGLDAAAKPDAGQELKSNAPRTEED